MTTNDPQVPDVVLDLTVHAPPRTPPSNRAILDWLRNHKGTLHDREMAHTAADVIEGLLASRTRQMDRHQPTSSFTEP